MSGSDTGQDRSGVLRLEIIDDCGRVLEAVYVSEITGTTTVPRYRRPSREPGTRRRDD